ncbi:MAG: hypothetical protein KKA81_16355 [Bacteroidetes bacterium]|nr:hypothetical protein [Bacteroidota bacterium]
MKQKIYCATVLLLLIFTLQASSVESARRDTSPIKPRKDLKLEPKAFVIAPYLTGGILVGDTVSTLIPDRGRRALYGLGLRVEYVLRPFLRLGLSGEALYAKVAEVDAGRGRALKLGAGAMWLIYPSRPGSFFGRAEGGLVKVDATNYSDGGLGTHPYLRFGLGHQLYSTPTVATRVELYYETALSKGTELSGSLFRGEIPINAQAIGLEFSVAFGL